MIREHDEEHVPREVVTDDDSHNIGDNEKSESGEDREFKIFDDEEAKKSECSGDSVVGECLVYIKDSLKVESLKSNDSCKNSKDHFSSVEHLRNHDFWIRTEAISCTREKINYTMDLIGRYRYAHNWLPEI